MSFMRKFLNLLDMDNWNGNSAFLRHLHVIRRLFFSIPTAILFLPNMFLFQNLTYVDGRKVNFAEYCMMCILYYAFVFIPINALIRLCQAKLKHMGFKEFLNAPDRLTRKNIVVSPEDSESTIADDFCTDISLEELEWIKNQYNPVSFSRCTESENNSVLEDKESTFSFPSEEFQLDIESCKAPQFSAPLPQLSSINNRVQSVPIISDKAEKSHETVSKPTTLSNTKQAGNLPPKKSTAMPKKKSVPISDVFLWQCNSIAELQDSDNAGYEYTNLDNPNDPMEVGYRNALLDISNYNTLPLIDYSKDKQAPDGYIPRKMLSWEHNFEQCNNIFANSNLPVISSLQYITRNINTMILQDPDGSIGRSVQEIFYYEIPKEYHNEYLQLLETLNLALHHQERFSIDLSKIVFTRTADSYREYALPLSCIYYNSEKHIFSYCFSNEIQFEENGLVKFKNTETGSIIYTEDGVLKKATFQKVIDEITYTCQFKNYKSGFDLYDIRGKGEIIYKRTPK